MYLLFHIRITNQAWKIWLVQKSEKKIQFNEYTRGLKRGDLVKMKCTIAKIHTEINLSLDLDDLVPI